MCVVLWWSSHPHRRHCRCRLTAEETTQQCVYIQYYTEKKKTHMREMVLDYTHHHSLSLVFPHATSKLGR